MIEIIKAIFFGIVEGITEWLPISSTGHMIILDEFVKLNVREEFWNLFLVVIQLGAILAVVLLFWNQIFPLNLKDKTSQSGRKISCSCGSRYWLPVFRRELSVFCLMMYLTNTYITFRVWQWH